MGEPFERLILDCVGPLPKSKSGHQYVLTLMCAATRFPEAVPLRTLKAQAVVKEIVKFAQRSDCPKLSKPIEVLTSPPSVRSSIKRVRSRSSAIQCIPSRVSGCTGTLSSTLKSMLRAYCLDTGKEWVEGLPMLLFAVRETMQESLGFSPAELVFGHTVRGP